MRDDDFDILAFFESYDEITPYDDDLNLDDDYDLEDDDFDEEIRRLGGIEPKYEDDFDENLSF